MRRAAIFLILFAVAPCLTLAQTQSPSRPPQKPEPDRLGMTCAQILKMSSQEWILYFGKTTHLDAANMPYDILRANAAYGKCYDSRTDALAASLARNGKGPSKAARADFAGFEAALKGFVAKALVVSQPAADPQNASYANLYEKQFRYLFYQECEAKTVKAVKPAGAAAKPPAPAASSATAAAQPPHATDPATSNAAASAAKGATTAQERARSDADPVTQAKNRFGKLLEVLPDDKMHELHRAFGDVIGPYQISEATRLAVYRYAISLLERPSATPPSEPPF